MPLTAAELEAKFDACEDVSDYVDWESGVRVNPGEPTPGQNRAMKSVVELDSVGSQANRMEVVLVSVALPVWATDRLKIDANRQGMSEEDLAQQFIVRQLEQEKALS